MTSAGGSASIAADRVNPPPLESPAAAHRRVPHHPPWRRRLQLRTALPWWQSRPPSDARALPRAVVVAAGARARLIHLVAGGLRGGPYDSTPSLSSLAEIRSPRQDLPPPPWRDPSPGATASGRDPPQAATRCLPWRDPLPGAAAFRRDPLPLQAGSRPIRRDPPARPGASTLHRSSVPSFSPSHAVVCFTVVGR